MGRLDSNHATRQIESNLRFFGGFHENGLNPMHKVGDKMGRGGGGKGGGGEREGAGSHISRERSRTGKPKR